MANLMSVLFSGELEGNLVKVNLLFIVVFLNIWDWFVSRQLFNGMALGVVMFSPAVAGWAIGKIKAISILTLISLIEFLMMLVFVVEGFELGGFRVSLKSVFWLPYLAMAGVNGFFGLRIYSAYKEKLALQKVRNSEGGHRGRK